MGQDDIKKAQQKLTLVQNDLEHLRWLLQQPDLPGREELIEHMIGENGILRPLGEFLNHLLEDPVIRQLLIAAPPPGSTKH